MGQIGNSALALFRDFRGGSDQLQDEPHRQNHRGTRIEHEAVAQRPHGHGYPQHPSQAAAGEAERVERDHAGDASAGADDGDGGTRVDRCVRQSTREHRHRDQGQVPSAAHPVLHVVAEHEEEVQVHQEMPDVLVQEERGRQGEAAESPQMGRDETEGVEGLVPEPESTQAAPRDHRGQGPRRPRPRVEAWRRHFHRQAAHEPDELLPAHVRGGHALDDPCALTLPHGRTLRAGARGERRSVTLRRASPPKRKS